MRERYTVFALSGRMESEHVPELKNLLGSEYRNIILDLRDLRLADRDAVWYLKGCESDGLVLENCPAYIRDWIDREKE